jgi:hypothetical protein
LPEVLKFPETSIDIDSRVGPRLTVRTLVQRLHQRRVRSQVLVSDGLGAANLPFSGGKGRRVERGRIKPARRRRGVGIRRRVGRRPKLVPEPLVQARKESLAGLVPDGSAGVRGLWRSVRASRRVRRACGGGKANQPDRGQGHCPFITLHFHSSCFVVLCWMELALSYLEPGPDPALPSPTVAGARSKFLSRTVPPGLFSR